jgi:hypothetical protein
VTNQQSNEGVASETTTTTTRRREARQGEVTRGDAAETKREKALDLVAHLSMKTSKLKVEENNERKSTRNEQRLEHRHRQVKYTHK